MTPDDQIQICDTFFRDGIDILNTKARDYGLYGIAMFGVYYEAAERNCEPEDVLWSYVRKHLTAVRQWLRGVPLQSEEIRSRLLDISNYMAMTWVINQHKHLVYPLLAELNETIPDLDDDERATMREWLEVRGHRANPSPSLQ